MKWYKTKPGRGPTVSNATVLILSWKINLFMSIFGRNQHLFQLFSLRSFETETYKEVGIKVGGKDQSQVVVYQAGEDSKEEKTKTKTKKQKKTQRMHCGDPPNPNVHQVGPREQSPQPEWGAQGWDLGSSLSLLSSPNSFWEEHLL